MSITGTELPTKVGVPIADLIAGMNGAYGVLAALHERERTGRGKVVRTSLLGRRGRSARVPGHPLDHRRRGARPGRRPPPVDRAVRHVRDRERADPDRLRFRGTVAGVLRCVRARRGRSEVRDQLRPGHPPRRADRGDRGEVRRPERRGLPGRAGRGRRPVGQGAQPRRRLQLGADPVPGAAARRRAPHSRAISRCPGHRSASTTTRSPAAGPPTWRRRRSTSTATRSGSGSTPTPDGQGQARARKSFSIFLASTPARPSSDWVRQCSRPVATMA